MTVEQREVPNIHSGGGPQGVAPVPLPDRDVRRKRPPFLSFVLRWETLRRVARVVSLLALDFIGVVGALFTAVMVKLAVHGQLDASVAWQDVKHWIAFAYLMTVLAFARMDLYADRTRRPGLARIATGLFQATVIALVFALADGQHFSSYFIFYGSLFFATIYIAALRELHLRVSGWVLDQAGYARRAVLVGSGKHIEEVARALADRSRTRVDIVGYISLTPRPRNGLRSLGAAARPAGRARARGRAGGDHRRPRLPAGQGGGARRHVPPARRDRPGRAVDDGDPDRPRGVRAGPHGPAVHAAPAGVRGRRLRDQAHVRPDRLDRRHDPALARAAGDRGSRSS